MQVLVEEHAVVFLGALVVVVCVSEAYWSVSGVGVTMMTVIGSVSSILKLSGKSMERIALETMMARRVAVTRISRSLKS